MKAGIGHLGLSTSGGYASRDWVREQGLGMKAGIGCESRDWAFWIVCFWWVRKQGLGIWDCLYS